MPAAVLAVAFTVARPEAFVVAGDPVTAADAPVSGGVNVTATFGTGLPLASDTSATRGFANAVPTTVLWPLPLLIVTVAGAPAVFVRAKEAGALPPATDAVTL